MQRLQLFSLSILLFFFGCKSTNEKNIAVLNDESDRIMKISIEDINIYKYHFNSDSLMQAFDKISKDSFELRSNFATRLRDQIDVLNYKRDQTIDSLSKIEREKVERHNADVYKQKENSKAGRIKKKHPEWSDEDCENLANRRIWIGMSIQMLVYLRGNPNSANPSNYGDGINWQWCWENYTPSCFYGRADGIITSYN